MTPVRSSFNFDSLQAHEESFTLLGKEYVLREANGAAVAEWRDATFRATKLEGGKPVSVDGIGKTEALLVSLCVFEYNEHADEKQRYKKVHENDVRAWPYRVVSKLHDRIMEISGLKEEDTEFSIQEKILELQQRLVQLKERNNGQETAAKN